MQALQRIPNLALFGAITLELPPTPARCHCILNLRGLSRIAEGVMIGNRGDVKMKKSRHQI